MVWPEASEPPCSDTCAAPCDCPSMPPGRPEGEVHLHLAGPRPSQWRLHSIWGEKMQI